MLLFLFECIIKNSGNINRIAYFVFLHVEAGQGYNQPNHQGHLQQRISYPSQARDWEPREFV